MYSVAFSIVFFLEVCIEIVAPTCSRRGRLIERGHDTTFLILSYSLLEKVCFAFQTNHVHPCREVNTLLKKERTLEKWIGRENDRESYQYETI
jgi:hypothetical protein